MNFKEATRDQLKKTAKDLDCEASKYEWGCEEFWFLMELIAMIEDEMRRQ